MTWKPPFFWQECEINWGNDRLFLAVFAFSVVVRWPGGKTTTQKVDATTREVVVRFQP